MPIWPSRRIVKVKIDRCREKNADYPFIVTSLESTVDFNEFYLAGLELIELYVSRKQGEKDQLEKAHREYAKLRSELRLAQRKYKWGLKMVAEYKKLKQLQTPFFVK